MGANKQGQPRDSRPFTRLQGANKQGQPPIIGENGRLSLFSFPIYIPPPPEDTHVSIAKDSRVEIAMWKAANGQGQTNRDRANKQGQPPIIGENGRLSLFSFPIYIPPPPEDTHVSIAKDSRVEIAMWKAANGQNVPIPQVPSKYPVVAGN